MSILVRDLPPEIRELVEIRVIKQNKIDYYNTNKDKLYLIESFTFSETEEGGLFWNNIDVGNYTPFYNRYNKENNINNSYTIF